MACIFIVVERFWPQVWVADNSTMQNVSNGRILFFMAGILIDEQYKATVMENSKAMKGC